MEMAEASAVKETILNGLRILKRLKDGELKRLYLISGVWTAG
jgi:hypothetical protein